MTGACAAATRSAGLSATAVVLAAALAACGGSPSHVSSAGPSRQNGALAFARCMRAHGVPDFPDPGPQGDFPSFRPGVSKPVAAAADGACRHLLRSGGTGTPQQRREKLAFALKVARCLRTHGFPTFPDPAASGQKLPPGIDTDSPRFEAAESSCEQQARKALGLP